MQKLFLTIGVVLIFLLSSFGQRSEPVSAPADVILRLGTEGDGQQFHLGELIPVKFSYSAKVPGTYSGWPEQKAGRRKIPRSLVLAFDGAC